MFTVPTTPAPYDINNPTKEILASSGIFDGKTYAPLPYAVDVPISWISNTGIQTTTTTTPQPSLITGAGVFASGLSSGNYFIDDMLIFNDYIHYAGTPRRFNTQRFLQEAVVAFNIYSLEFR
jgi:hypothetical protein